MLLDKYQEIQNENRILLKKMLAIDIHPSNLNPSQIQLISAPSAYSLNRQQRIKELSRVTEENKHLLRRLQSAHSVYNHSRWEAENRNKNYLIDMICRNSGRFCRHPYFIQTEMGTTIKAKRSMSQQQLERVNPGKKTTRPQTALNKDNMPPKPSTSKKKKNRKRTVIKDSPHALDHQESQESARLPPGGSARPETAPS